MVGFFGDDCAGGEGLEVGGGVDVVDAEDGEAAVEGVAPAAADGGEGIDEVVRELEVYDVVGGCVEVAAEDDGSGVRGGGEFEGF